MHEIGRAAHASTEQLSAMLDGRAELDERAFLAGHVDQCVVCSNELADLRSVRDLLRALPVYLPPRSFALPVEAPAALPPRPFRRLVSITRTLAAIAAVCCVMLFSVEAMQISYDAPLTVPEGGSAMQLTTRATIESSRASDQRPVAREQSQAERTAEALPKSANPSAPAAQPAAAFAPPATQAPFGAAAQTIATAATPVGPMPPRAPAAGAAAPPPPGSGLAQTGPTPVAQAPSQDDAVVPGQPRGASSPTASWLSPIRLWSLAFALVAATLLIVSLVLGRASRARGGPSDEWTRS